MSISRLSLARFHTLLYCTDLSIWTTWTTLYRGKLRDWFVRAERSFGDLFGLHCGRLDLSAITPPVHRGVFGGRGIAGAAWP